MQHTLLTTGGEALAWTAGNRAHTKEQDSPAGGPGQPRDPGLPRLLLTPEEAAHALGIGRTKLYQLLADGFLPSVRIGGSRRISTAALDQFVRGLEPATVGGGLARP